MAAISVPMVLPAPAPGGQFRQGDFEETPYGPRLAGATTYAEVSMTSETDVGWSVLVSCRIDDAVIGDEDEPVLGHRRGRFFRLGSSA